MLEILESRWHFDAASPLEAQMITWINQDRANPVAATTRVGVTLNQDLPTNYISPDAKHALRWNSLLADVADQWLDFNMQHGLITHDWGDSNVWSRVTGAGYQAIHAVENGGITTSSSIFFGQSSIDRIAKSIHDLFVCHAGHRAQLFDDQTREVGISIKTGVWNGQPAEMVFVEMAARAPISGDFNEDGQVDSLDFNIYIGNYGTTGTPPFSQGNANGDSIIDTLDFNILASNWGTNDFM